MRLTTFAHRYLRPYLGWYAAGTVALLVTNGISVSIPLVIADGIDALAPGGAGASAAVQAALIAGGLGVVVIFIRTASRVLYFTPGRNVEAKVKEDLLTAMLHQRPAFLANWSAGDLFSRISSDVNQVRLLAGFGMLQLVNAAVAVSMAGAQMARIAPSLAMQVALPLLVAMAIVQLLIQRMYVLMHRQQEEMAALSDHILTSYQGVGAIQGFCAEPAFNDAFDRKNEAYLHTAVQRTFLRSLMGPLLAFAAAIDVFILLYFGGPMAISGEISVGELVAFATLVNQITLPLRASSFLVAVFRQGQASLERIGAITEPVPDRPDAATRTEPGDRAPEVSIRGLTYAWPGSDTPALREVTLTLPAGHTLGILGPVGSGKTTLLRLLARLDEPPAGTLFIDGVDVRELDLDAWRQRVTYVTQQPFLFSDPIADNVLLGDSDDARLRFAVKQAALEPDLDALPQGLGTLVGESGVRLSGGQRQRVALARALARSHQLLLLDDVLSAVDHHTEAELIQSLRAAGGEGRCTTVIIANRVSALAHADLVLVLEEGRIAQLGSPADLQQQPGRYRDTWLAQQVTEARA